MITLQNDRFRLSVDPAMGASVGRFEVATAEGWVPVLAPRAAPARTAGDTAMFLMAPFANRARGNRLALGTRRIELAPNTDEPLALHGIAWQRSWEVIETTAGRIALGLDTRGHDPLDLRMEFMAELRATGVRFGLSLRNTGARAVPCGIGFHPYFPRLTDTQVAFAARTLWPEGPGHLPLGKRPLPAAEAYSTPRGLPEAWRNQCYSGWDGRARITQPSLGYGLEMRGRGLPALMLFADPGMARFALEPQSHVSGETGTGPHGLTVLPAGQSISAELTLKIAARPAG
ncbi:hypothetical protein [Marinovum sp.]|uniref:aldose epimerase family protein n=1 Tax=Marinovum sp. TaxID=2024839 RepID=UPI002B27812E|nr:hypothetical protein [Marinovum sp.]